MDRRYKPNTMESKIGWLVEECGELQAALGKTIRHGLGSYNPEPGASGERNAEWILREMKDVERAIKLLREAILAAGPW